MTATAVCFLAFAITLALWLVERRRRERIEAERDELRTQVGFMRMLREYRMTWPTRPAPSRPIRSAQLEGPVTPMTIEDFTMRIIE